MSNKEYYNNHLEIVIKPENKNSVCIYYRPSKEECYLADILWIKENDNYMLLVEDWLNSEWKENEFNKLIDTNLSEEPYKTIIGELLNENQRA